MRTHFVALLFTILCITSCGSNQTPTDSKKWGTPELLESNTGDAESPKIAFDPSGNGIAVWSQNAGGVANIWYSSYSGSTKTWGTAKLIASNAIGLYPQISMNASGDAIAVWYQTDSTNQDIWASRFSAATQSWSTASLIQTDISGYAMQPDVAIDRTGNAIAVWYQSDGSHTYIWANHYSIQTDSWGVAQIIEPVDSEYAENPKIAVDGTGNAIAVWWQSDGIMANIWANRYDASMATWGTAAKIQQNAHAVLPQIAMNQSGNAAVVWAQLNNMTYNIGARYFFASTNSWDGTTVIQSDTSQDAQYPKIAIDSSGNAMAVWPQSNGTNYITRATRYNYATHSWGSAEIVSTHNYGSNFPNVAVAYDAQGNAIVTDNTGYTIWASYYRSSLGKWDNTVNIGLNNFGAAYTPQVSFEISGDATIVWSQYDGTYFSIYSNSYR